MINVPNVKALKPLNEISKGKLCTFTYKQIPYNPHANIAIIDKNDHAYIQTHNISRNGIVEFIIPQEESIKTIMIYPNDNVNSVNMSGIFKINNKDFHIERDIYSNDIDIYNTLTYSNESINSLKKYEFNTDLESYETIKERILLNTLNISCFVVLICLLFGFQNFAFSYGIGTITNIMYMLILQKEIDDLDNNSVRLPLFPVRIIIFIIMASILFHYEKFSIAFFLGFSSGKISLLLEHKRTT